MGYFVYVLKSERNGDLYIGSTENVEKRLALHNGRRVRSTKGHAPWQLLEYHQFPSRSQAVRHERFLKTGQQKEILRRKYGSTEGAVVKW
jgi:putative endonuclease